MSIFNSFNKLFKSFHSNPIAKSKEKKTSNATKAHFRYNLSRTQYDETTNKDVLSTLFRGFRALN